MPNLLGKMPFRVGNACLKVQGLRLITRRRQTPHGGSLKQGRVSSTFIKPIAFALGPCRRSPAGKPSLARKIHNSSASLRRHDDRTDRERRRRKKGDWKALFHFSGDRIDSAAVASAKAGKHERRNSSRLKPDAFRDSAATNAGIVHSPW